MISPPVKRFLIQLTLTFVLVIDNTLATSKYIFPFIQKISILYH